MKLVISWLLDLTSNFRLHIAVLSFCIMVLTYFASSKVLAAIFLFPFLYALFPLRSWLTSYNITQDNAEFAYQVASFNLEWNASEYLQSLDYIKNSPADIVVLQEVVAAHKSHIAEYSDYFCFQLGDGHSHVMVLSKHEAELIEVLPWPGKYQQRALHVLCKLDGKPLHIFAIHIQVTRSWHEIDLRNQQIDTLVTEVNKLDQPVLIVGDFNAGTGSNVLRQIEKRANLNSADSLTKHKSTWPSKLGVLGVQLDHIYCNQHIIMSKLHVGPVLDSDHRPISSKFNFV